jgi:hypothetical protein
MTTREEVEKATWYGKPVSALQREELLDIIAYMQDRVTSQAENWGRIEQLRTLGVNPSARRLWWPFG